MSVGDDAVEVRALTAVLANAAWFASAIPSERLFRAALDDPRRAQETLLNRNLAHNADTVIGKRYGFADIRTIEQFQRRVPLHDYDALAPDIDRIAAGEPRVLTADQVVRLATSSGSTAARKLIPYTAALQREFNRAIGPWIVDLFRGDPQLMGGSAYWSITPVGPRPPRRAGEVGPPVGFEEDSAYLGGIRKRLIDAVMAVPSEVRHTRDFASFRRATLDHLLRRRDLRLISVWHPSFLELLLGEEDFDYRSHWPQLRLISCWADAHAAAPAAALAERFPGVRVQPKGLLATEAFVTIPFGGQRPLAVRSHFFEFLDERERAHCADGLRPGVRYGVAVTTTGGLWRYRLGDAVEVEGYVGRTPSLRFVGREDSVSDLRGEKLSEGFVGRAIREVLASCDVAASFSMLAPEDDRRLPRYVLYMESPTPPPPELAARLDAALRANPHYDQCRLLGQLAPASAVHLRDNAFARYASELARAGQRMGNIKPSPLSRRSWAAVFPS
jgi:GH3 auxin-responsive promoter